MTKFRTLSDAQAKAPSDKGAMIMGLLVVVAIIGVAVYAWYRYGPSQEDTPALPTSSAPASVEPTPQP